MIILLVEDNPEVRRSIGRYLGARNSHFKFIEARNGKEALVKLKAGANIDLIISDIQMNEMDGIEFAAIIEKDYPELNKRFVFFSSEIGFGDKGYPFILKPNIVELEKEIKKYESISVS